MWSSSRMSCNIKLALKGHYVPCRFIGNDKFSIQIHRKWIKFFILITTCSWNIFQNTCNNLLNLKQILCFSYRKREVTNKMNKTNHPISSNSHTSATANKEIHSLKWGGGATKPTGTSYNFDKVWSVCIINVTAASLINRRPWLKMKDENNNTLSYWHILHLKHY